ncbi:MAG: hypothetical protein ACYTX0_58330, partial [Nostoc sp.]
VGCSTLKILVENTIFKLALPTAVTEQFSKLTVRTCPTTSLRDATRSLSSAGVRGSKLRVASAREVRAIRRRVKVIPSCN